MAAAYMLVTSWAAAFSRVGVGPQAQDSLSQHFVDSVVVKSPLPDPLIPVVQWIFQRPGWVMAGGIVLGAIVTLAVLVFAWRWRRAIWTWLVTRERGVKLAMAGAVGTVLLLMVGTSVKAYDYMMHDNDFCAGCHIFVPSGQLFVRPDTGAYLLVNKQEGKHDTLSCHACHPFEIRNQTKTLLNWMVARPDKIPPHAKVPRQVCEECHVTGPAKDKWKRITTTAGHRTHLDSDSAPLKARSQPGSRLRPPRPFDTTRALQQSSSREPPRGLIVPGRARGQGAAPPEEDPPQSRTDVSASPSDTFPHKCHSRLACLTCHDLRSKGRPLTFEAPRGCQICHHQRPAASKCSACHQESELADPRPVTVQVTVFRHARRAREVDFAHQSHRDVACVKCHQTPVSLAPTPEAASCAGCHESHHTADRDCATCHRTAEIVTAHKPPVDAHLACNRCHASATVAALTPSRSFCLACHDPKVNHYAPKECTLCHLQATPEGYRARLTGAGSRR